jgi:hypothetical protein
VHSRERPAKGGRPVRYLTAKGVLVTEFIMPHAAGYPLNVGNLNTMSVR